MKTNSLDIVVNILFGFQIDGLAMISESDWKYFSEDWSVAHANGICAEIVFSKSSQDKLHESPVAKVILDEDPDQSINDTNGDLEDSTPYVRTDSEVNYVLESLCCAKSYRFPYFSILLVNCVC